MIMHLSSETTLQKVTFKKFLKSNVPDMLLKIQLWFKQLKMETNSLFINILIEEKRKNANTNINFIIFII